MTNLQNRRRFLAGLTATGATGLICSAMPARAEPPPETTTVRLARFSPASCEFPTYIAEELLRAEGFSDVRYVAGDPTVDTSIWLARGEIDFDYNYAAIHIGSIASGVPITVLAGLHSGCIELVANDSIRSIAGLKGKRVGVYAPNTSPHMLVSLMVSYIGLDPAKDINWVFDAAAASKDLFVEGKVDAFLAIPPEPQDLRARKIGHTILATATDSPWSEYYCCMLAADSGYAGKYPVATKRVMRALFKAIDFCATSPKAAAKQLVGAKFTEQYDTTLEALSDIRYDRWRDFDPEDTMRFYALRMQETGMIKASPQEIIANGTDWRFLSELKREMKI